MGASHRKGGLISISCLKRGEGRREGRGEAGRDRKKKKEKKERNLGLATSVSYIPSFTVVCTQSCRATTTAPSPSPGRSQYLDVAVFPQRIACQVLFLFGNLAVSTSWESGLNSRY